MLGAALGLLSGCRREPGTGAFLTIATAWSEAERTEVEREFARWVEGQPVAAPRIAWIVLAPADDLGRIARRPAWGLDPRGRAPDILLGGPASSYRRLARAGRLAGADRPDGPPWRVVRRASIGWLMSAPAAAAARRPDLGFDDPRRAPVALAWARGELGRGAWADGYARLVREAGGPRRIGRVAGSSLGAVERGGLEATPAVGPGRWTRAGGRTVFQAIAGAPEWLEGVAIVAGGRRLGPARSFLRFLAERGTSELPPDPPRDSGADDDESDGLLADLLGATLVDAQDELWNAWQALDRAGNPPRAERWMTEAPPWPPASVAKLGQRDGSGTLTRTLAEQVAPDPTIRAWLLRSWLEPERPIDGRRLAELSQAAEGRLMREPRFRAWLRAEWTAWARQRYRRVARTAAVEGPAS